MLMDKLFIQNDIIGTGMQASLLRNEVISHNIANADVPDYKARYVTFEDSLIKALDRTKRGQLADLSGVKAEVKVLHKNYNYRIDKNNVDIETEMVKLYQNSVVYDTLVSGIQNNSKCLSLVLQGR